jgi:hypothetical protein
MNFEEHCEVFLTSHDNERQRDGDILAKCLLAARTKGKNLATLGKVTVDSPIPYLLTDLSTIINDIESERFSAIQAEKNKKTKTGGGGSKSKTYKDASGKVWPSYDAYLAAIAAGYNDKPGSKTPTTTQPVVSGGNPYTDK